ncbi:shematrin-like protein 2 [Schistocerca gregaria]|uniref:shematrin-like protein 2 n=1 Tax=Schistocerca gregaria TaxID=7010 RepID=UPI00211DC476|nr:shematrin-like protein 2 [Schistocerca gregaria]
MKPAFFLLCVFVAIVDGYVPGAFGYSGLGQQYGGLGFRGQESFNLGYSSLGYRGQDYVRPVYDSLGYGQQQFGGVGYLSPGYGSPGYGGQNYVSPLYDGLGYGQHQFGGPGYLSPRYGPPSYGGKGLSYDVEIKIPAYEPYGTLPLQYPQFGDIGFGGVGYGGTGLPAVNIEISDPAYDSYGQLLTVKEDAVPLEYGQYNIPSTYAAALPTSYQGGSNERSSLPWIVSSSGVKALRGMCSSSS